jgi:hypothetical protein
MTARRRSVTRRGSILALAGLVTAAGCAARRPQTLTIPQPLRLQTAVAVDRQGNEILAGAFAGHVRIGGAELTSAGRTDGFLVKTAPNGTPVFPPEHFGGPGEDAVTGVAVDEDGSIVLAGTFQGQARFEAQVLEAQVRHQGQRGVFVARLDPTGKVLWVKQIAVANLPTQVSVAVRPDHNIVVGASGTGTIADRNGPAELSGESIVLDLLSPAGELLQEPGKSKIRAMSIPVGCAHSPCTTGVFLAEGCGPDDCVSWICNADSYCCNVAWDSVCVAEVGTVCQRRCDCGTICTTGAPFYPSACACTMDVYNQDSYCSENWWDNLCVSEAVNLCHIVCQ